MFVEFFDLLYYFYQWRKYIMRFCDFFISYKIGLKGIKSSIPFTKLPLYRKIAVITTFTTGILAIILGLINQQNVAFVVLILGILLMIIFLTIDSTKKSLDTMLQEHYIPYSQNRINMVIDLLKNYNVFDNSSIDLLIVEAQDAQLRCDYFAPLKKPLKTLSTIIIPTPGNIKISFLLAAFFIALYSPISNLL